MAEDQDVTNVVEQPAEAEIDYDQELKEQAEKFEQQTAHNRAAYERRKKEEVKEKVEAPDMVAAVREEVAKILPQMQSIAQENQMQTILNELTDNAQEQKLIKFHYENSISPQGSMRERLENAQLLANKKKILTQNKELKTALQNRSQISNSSGVSTQGSEVQDHTFSADQLKYFKDRGWSKEKIERFKLTLKKTPKMS